MKPMIKRKEKRVSDKKLLACIDGKLMPLGAVADPVFASRLYGEGVAIVPEDDVIVAPCNGTITMLAYNRQAIGIETEQGDMVLIHIGFNTAQYGEKAFEALATEGTKVKPGMPLITINRHFLESVNADMTVCMVITNLKKIEDYRVLEGDVVSAGKTPVLERKI